MDFKTPGVFIQEVSTLPPSVVPVETAIPAFIGYTELAGGTDPSDRPFDRQAVRISSPLEYERTFGGAPIEEVTVHLEGEVPVNTALENGFTSFRMYRQVQLFFRNGGGPCYIISVGGYDSAILKTDLDESIVEQQPGGLAVARKVDEITLLLFPDADDLKQDDQARGLDDTDYYSLYADALRQCAELKDRFTLIDIRTDIDTSSDPQLQPVGQFRNKIGNLNLNYGAAYYPWLLTTQRPLPEQSRVKLEGNNQDNVWSGQLLSHLRAFSVINEQLEVSQAAINGIKDIPAVDTAALMNAASGAARAAILALETARNAARFTGAADPQIFDQSLNDAQQLLQRVDQVSTKTSARELTGAALALISKVPENEGDTPGVWQTVKKWIDDNTPDNVTITAEQITGLVTTSFLAQVRDLVEGINIQLPPSGAIAGVYAQVDNARGVFKAPANVSLNAVVGPTVKITNEEQRDLNDPPSGKAVNAIRAFAGKGILVWGARTMASTSNEWRYVNVRRFFIFAEKSIKNTVEPFVFEPNDANTWDRLRGLIENFLLQQWRTGALTGTTPEQAFFVAVGLGETMTAQDILEGRLIIEVGMAVVRPAEFIILRFTHRLQEA